MIPPNSPRPATKDDLSSILRLEKGAHINPWVESHFVTEMSKPYSRVIVLTDDETDSVLFGYIVYWLIEEECHLLNCVVGENFRRQGLGKKLIQIAIHDAVRSQMKKFTLEVRHSNSAAIGLYQSIGFSITQVRKNFYSNGEDAYFMMLPLEGERFEF